MQTKLDGKERVFIRHLSPQETSVYLIKGFDQY